MYPMSEGKEEKNLATGVLNVRLDYVLHLAFVYGIHKSNAMYKHYIVTMWNALKHANNDWV